MVLVLGPGLALAVVVLCLCLATGARGRRRTRTGRFGLLVPVGRALPWERAAEVRQRLTQAGVRATVARAGRGFDADGREWASEAAYVLVFPDDLAAAEGVLRTQAQPSG